MTQQPAERFLALIAHKIETLRDDVGRFIDVGEKMALPLLDGGSLFTPNIGTYWPSEFGGRAGGLMGLKPPDYVAQSPNDVAFTTLPDLRKVKLRDDPRWRRLIESPAKIFIIGSPDDLGDAAPPERFSGYTLGAPADEGLYALGEFSPLAPLRPFEQLLRGWLTAGEMIAACTRHSDGAKMPIIWMSVWLDGALPRNAHFFRHDNVREPWYPPLFHDSIHIPPLAAGHVANQFLAELSRMFTIVKSQANKLATAGAWMADAIRAKKKVSTVLVGHMYPQALEITNTEKYPLAWLPSISDLQHAHPRELGAGDVAFHLGYSPVNVDDVQQILNRGVRFIYTSPYGRPQALKDHANLLWLDLPWRPGDATVDVPGYSVRILPMSSSAHTMVYFSAICELAEKMGWR